MAHTFTPRSSDDRPFTIELHATTPSTVDKRAAQKAVLATLHDTAGTDAETVTFDANGLVLTFTVYSDMISHALISAVQSAYAALRINSIAAEWSQAIVSTGPTGPTATLLTAEPKTAKKASAKS